MAKSWLDWLTGKSAGDWDRRKPAERELPAVRDVDRDPETGTMHWVQFTAILEAELKDHPGVLLVIDLDDRSAAIEAVADDNRADILPWLARSIEQAVRGTDLVAHLQGYKFAVLLRGASQDVASQVAARIRESVDDTLFMTASGIARLGVAVGGVSFPQAQAGEGGLLDAALADLGAAKSEKDQIHIS